MQQDQHKAAYDELKPLLAKNLQDSIGGEVQLAEGICLRKIGQADKAIAALNRFIDRKPKAYRWATVFMNWDWLTQNSNSLSKLTQRSSES